MYSYTVKTRAIHEINEHIQTQADNQLQTSRKQENKIYMHGFIAQGRNKDSVHEENLLRFFDTGIANHNREHR